MALSVAKVLAGNSILLSFTFRNWYGEVIIVSNIQLKIYGKNNEVIFNEDITGRTFRRENLYNFIYTTPLDHDNIIIEVATVFDNAPVIHRRAVSLVKSRNF